MIKIVWDYGIGQADRTSEAYPRRLHSIAGAPDCLYYRGNIECINQNYSIAVIGSRRVSEYGRTLAYQIGYALGRRGINVVNGLALGCDTYALCGALAAGGTCVAVMPCGLERIVPQSNTILAEKLLSNGGCLVSEYPPSAPVLRYQYVERDRIQSGISDGVLVIEAAMDSGTMHTVQYAVRQGRALACIGSQLVQYHSGNQWIEGQNGACVIRETGDLDCFITAIQQQMVYRQMTLEMAVNSNKTGMCDETQGVSN